MFLFLPSFCLLWCLITQHSPVYSLLCTSFVCSCSSTTVSGSSAKDHTVLILEMEETPSHHCLLFVGWGTWKSARLSALPKVTRPLVAG